MKKYIFVFLLATITCFNALRADTIWVAEPVTSTPYKDQLTKNPFYLGNRGELNLFYIRNKATGMMQPPDYEFHHLYRNEESDWSEPKILSAGEDFRYPDPSFALSPEGDFYMAYLGMAEDNSSVPFISYDYLVFAEKDGENWVQLDNPIELDTAFSNNDLSLFCDENGALHLTWTASAFDEDISEYLQFFVYASNISGTWESQYIDVGESYWSYFYPVVSPTGIMHFLFKNNDDELCHMFNDEPGGTLWEQHVVETGFVNLSKFLAKFSDGETIQMITEGTETWDNNIHELRHLEFNGQNWSTAEAINFSSQSVLLLSFEFNSNEEMNIIFSERTQHGFIGDVYIASKTETGTFDEVMIYPASQTFAAHLGFDSDNNPIVFIADNNNLFLVRQLEEILLYEANFIIVDNEGDTIHDALITLDGNQNPAGDYTFEELEPGTYTYTISKDGFYSVEDELTITDQDLEIEVTLQRDITSTDYIAENSFKIFPNPASSRVNLSAPENITSATIFDLTGRFILNAQPDTEKISLNISEIPAGVYLIVIETASGGFHQKLTISK